MQMCRIYSGKVKLEIAINAFLFFLWIFLCGASMSFALLGFIPYEVAILLVMVPITLTAGLITIIVASIIMMAIKKRIPSNIESFREE